MGKQFDELSKALAAGVSRREALRRFAGGIAGAALVSLFPRAAAAGGGNSACAKLCKELYPPGPERGECISASAKCPPGQCATFELNEGQRLCFPIGES